MGVLVLLLLEVVVQLLAVGLAFRLARIGGRLAPWGAVGAAIGVIVLWPSWRGAFRRPSR
jgi:hypothetical protein